MSPNPRVLHVELGIVLNVTKPDLGHPELPDLWQRLRSKPISAGILQCVECAEKRPEAPQWMYLRDHHRRTAVHLNPGTRACLSAPESDLHKAMKEFVVTVAEREGLTAQAEAHSGRRVVSDVEITGGAVDLSVEAEIKDGTAESVIQRSRLRQGRGLQPLWFSDKPFAKFNYRVPSAAIAPTTPWRMAAGLDTLITEGVRTLDVERCGRKGPKCPRTGGRPCGRLHVDLAPVRLAHIDKLIVGAATGDYVSLERVNQRKRFYFWLTAADYERYHDDQRPPSDPTPESDEELQKEREQSRKLDFACSRSKGPPEPRAIAIPAHLAILDRKFSADGTCNAGFKPCGEPARFYPCGWRCDAHSPGAQR